MEIRNALQALQIAVVVGVTVELILTILLKHELPVVSLLIHTFCTYMMFKHNELFWELVEKYNWR
jgi:EamA domain-containing membrane protein RarD